jgi:hypothetical protein
MRGVPSQDLGKQILLQCFIHLHKLFITVSLILIRIFPRFHSLFDQPLPLHIAAQR